MSKRRQERRALGKKRKVLWCIVWFFFLLACGLGGFITHKLLEKQAFQTQIETIVQKAETTYRDGSQEDHFRKGKGEVLAYYPKKDDQELLPIKDAIIETVKQQADDKQWLYVYAASKDAEVLSGVQGWTVHKQVYDLSTTKVESLEDTSITILYLTDDGQAFTLDRLFVDGQKAKEKLLQEIKANLEENKLQEEQINQLVADWQAQDLSAWKFTYGDSQLDLYPLSASDGLEKVSLPVSSLFDVIRASYLPAKDAALYQAYQDARHKKVIALTFDDGPNPVTTPQALETLKKYDVKATFFTLGKNIAGNEELLKKMKAEGHEIGNHSWNHPALPSLSLEEAKKQITDTEEALKGVLGTTSKLMRPPYGAITADISKSVDMSFIMWDVDTLDWKSHSEAAILAEVQHQVRNGSIILLHDIHKASVHSLPKVIEYLKDQGYSFVTVSDLLGTRLKPHQIYYSRDE